MDKHIIELAIKHTQQTNIDPALVLGIIQVESGGDSNTARYEQNYRWVIRQARRPEACSENTETVFQKTRWGLMQVLGAAAREHGYYGWLSKLIDPELNIIMGICRLQKLFALWGEDHGIDGVIAAYADGAPRVTENGFANKSYVGAVKAVMTEFGPIIAEMALAPKEEGAAGEKEAEEKQEAAEKQLVPPVEMTPAPKEEGVAGETEAEEKQETAEGQIVPPAEMTSASKEEATVAPVSPPKKTPAKKVPAKNAQEAPKDNALTGDEPA